MFDVRRASGRSPSGERGLKLFLRCAAQIDELSLPIRGAWIEIIRTMGFVVNRVSLPIRGAWIEITSQANAYASGASRSPSGERGLKYLLPRYDDGGNQSLPIRGAWIEIAGSRRYCSVSRVAPHPGSVD